MIHFQHLKRRKWFAAIDFLSVCGAVWVSLYIRTKVQLPVFAGLLPDSLPSGFSSIWLPTALLALTFVFIQYAFGVFDLWHSSSLGNWLQRVLPANLALIATAFSYLYLTQNFSFPRSLLAVLFGVNYLVTALWRVLYFKITEADLSDVVLVGQWADVSPLIKEIATPPFSSHLRVVAVFLSGSAEIVPQESQRSYLCLPFEEFENYTSRNPHTSVILAPSDTFQRQAFQCVLNAAQKGLSIYAVPTIYEILLGRLQHLRINDLPLLELRLEPPSGLSVTTKRIFDVTLSAFLLVILAPLMICIGALVKITSAGPAVYTQVRVGYMGREFRIYKFRSMVVNADAVTGFKQAIANDSRFTPLGKILRKVRIDELPQLFNILKGDMSFVGPRPLVREETALFEERIPGFSGRHRIRPGVTGLAQVSGGYLSSPEVKLKYDLAYITNQNIFFDAQILFRTVKTVFAKVGV
jgi:exopolysaccharide biosynthesis polyprenyl glycosylphosphotransferase